MPDQTPAPALDAAKYRRLVQDVQPLVASGAVNRIVGLVIEGSGPRTSVGGVCEIRSEGRPVVEAEIVGFGEDKIFLMALGDMRHIAPRSRIVATTERATVRVGDAMLGRVLDGLGEPLDGKRRPLCTEERLLYGRPLNPATRQRISQPLDLGVRVLNGLLTLGKGQKIGIFAGSGVGKSVLLGMIARHTRADVNVIALIGERGREVREFLERDLGPEGRARSVVIAATSDQSPLVRMRGAFLGTAIAEHFRAQGKHVLFMMDSLTRFAMARREVGLSVGEPPTTRGYTPSVFTLMPALLERVGNDDGDGSITGIYTVLVEADDLNDPIGDASRSILDGHVVLSRALASRNQYPAVDVLASTSRCMTDVAGREHLAAAARFRSTLATYRDAEDLITIGAYAKGSAAKIDDAIAKIGALNAYVAQPVNQKVTFEDSVQHLASLFAQG